MTSLLALEATFHFSVLIYKSGLILEYFLNCFPLKLIAVIPGVLNPIISHYLGQFSIKHQGPKLSTTFSSIVIIVAKIDKMWIKG